MSCQAQFTPCDTITNLPVASYQSKLPCGILLFPPLQLGQCLGTEVAFSYLPLVVLLREHCSHYLTTAASFGKLLTNSVLLFTSLISLSSG